MNASTWIALFVSAEPYLRDCNESLHVKPIAAFCRSKAADISSLVMPLDSPLSQSPVHSLALTLALELPVRVERVRDYAEVSATLRASASGLFFDGYLVGPSQIALLVEESTARPGEYVARARVYDGGEYSLELTLMWESRAMAFAPELGQDSRLNDYLDVRSPRSKALEFKLPLCRPLTRAPSAPMVAGRPPLALERFQVPLPPRLQPAKPCAPFGSTEFRAGARADVGRWLSDAPVSIAGTWSGECMLRWQPIGCVLVPYTKVELQACASTGARVLFLGDSHTREAHLVLTGLLPSLGSEWTLSKGTGLTVKQARDRLWSSRSKAAIDAAAGNLRDAAGKPVTHLVLNFGSWDLEYLPAERVLADWTLLLGKLLQARSEALAKRAASGDELEHPPFPQIIWRMTPATAYRFDHWPVHKYHTNQKVRWVVTRQQEYLNWATSVSGGIPWISTIDSFAITHPRCHDSVDTHHHLLYGVRPFAKSFMRPRTCGAAIAPLSLEERTRAAARTGSEVARANEPGLLESLEAAEQLARCPFGISAANSVGVSDLTAILNGICNGRTAVAAPSIHGANKRRKP